MKVYVAAPWARKPDARAVAARLEASGVTVTSRWLKRPEVEYECDPAVMQAQALCDLEDIGQSDAMLYLSLEKSEGKATEMGFALAHDMPIYALGGTAGNVFLHLPCIRHLGSVDEFLSLTGK